MRGTGETLCRRGPIRIPGTAMRYELPEALIFQRPLNPCQGQGNGLKPPAVFRDSALRGRTLESKESDEAPLRRRSPFW